MKFNKIVPSEHQGCEDTSAFPPVQDCQLVFAFLIIPHIFASNLPLQSNTTYTNLYALLSMFMFWFNRAEDFTMIFLQDMQKQTVFFEGCFFEGCFQNTKTSFHRTVLAVLQSCLYFSVLSLVVENGWYQPNWRHDQGDTDKFQ